MTSDDYGLYIFNVTSICGYTSSVNITINGTIEDTSGEQCYLYWQFTHCSVVIT